MKKFKTNTIQQRRNYNTGKKFLQKKVARRLGCDKTKKIRRQGDCLVANIITQINKIAKKILAEKKSEFKNELVKVAEKNYNTKKKLV